MALAVANVVKVELAPASMIETRWFPFDSFEVAYTIGFEPEKSATTPKAPELVLVGSVYASVQVFEL